MPSFEGFSAWVTTGSGNGKQQEFKRVTDIPGRSTVCHIVSETGKRFVVHWRLPSGAADFCINLFIDGKYLDDRVDPAHLGRRVGSFGGVQSDKHLAFLDPKFVELGDYDVGGSDIYSGPLPLAACPSAKEAGTIHVEMFEVMIINGELASEESDTDTDDTWKKCKDLGNGALAEGKSSTLTHTVNFVEKHQEKVVAAEKLEECYYKPFSEPKPITSFTFQYRSKGFLEAAGILLKPPTDNRRSSARLTKRNDRDWHEHEDLEPQPKIMRRESTVNSAAKHTRNGGSRRLRVGDAEQDVPKPEPEPASGSHNVGNAGAGRGGNEPARADRELEDPELYDTVLTVKEIEKMRMLLARERIAIDEQAKRLEMRERLLDEQQKRIQCNDSEDRKPADIRAQGKKTVLKNEVEVMDLTGD